MRSGSASTRRNRLSSVNGDGGGDSDGFSSLGTRIVTASATARCALGAQIWVGRRHNQQSA